MTTPTTRRFDLVGHLVTLAERENRGALAALRRGLGKEPGETAEMFPIVEPRLDEDASENRRRAAYLVASLFASHPVHRDAAQWSRRSFGASLRAARFRDNGDADPGIEGRFEALLDCEADALATHLRGLVTLLRARNPGAAIDFRQLLRDIEWWDADDRHVQRNWATGFWGGRADDPGFAGEGHTLPPDDNDDNDNNDTDS